MSIDKKQLFNVLNRISPERLSEDWDNSGVQIDTEKEEVSNVLVALEVNQEVIQEAIKKEADMIICHHPLIFSNMKKIENDNPTGSKIIKLIQKDISVYAMHTSFDSTVGGNNDYILKKMKWENEGVLLSRPVTYYKIVVFVPKEQLNKVKEAMCNNGAGHIGDYKNCTFYSEGVGTFTPMEGSTPYIGEKNNETEADEYKLESIISEKDLKVAVEKMLSVHPYEEPAYDIVKLENHIQYEGLGRIVELKNPKTTKEILLDLKSEFDIKESIKYTSENKEIKRVAVCTGSGADLITQAKLKGCDLFITGDIKYHDAQLAKELNIDLIDMEHFHSEKIFVPNLIEQLQCEVGEKISIIESEIDLNPFEKA